MRSSSQPPTKSELSLFEEIIECPRCLSSENVCSIHAEFVKSILIKEAKAEMEKLMATKNTKLSSTPDNQ
ncbi:MAG: hypothetical protein K5777_08320 [Nitrosopumilus sp.]|nr:hypothetical protein [Nitrosopumilus sp.]